MIRRTLTLASNILRGGAPAVAGTGDTLTGAEIDMLGFSACLFVVILGAVTATATATLTVKNSDTSNTYGAGTIDTLTHAGSGAVIQAVGTTGDSSKVLLLEVYKPPRRFLRPQLARATANVVVEGWLAIPFDPVNRPATLTGIAAAGSVTASDPIPSAT